MLNSYRYPDGDGPPFPANIKLVPGSAQELEKDEAKKVQLKDQLHLSIQRRAVGIAPLMPGRYNFKRLLKFIGLKK